MTMFQTLGRMMAYNDTLKVRCVCGHEATFSCKDAFALFGTDAAPYDVRRRMRCTAPECRKVGQVDVWI